MKKSIKKKEDQAEIQKPYQCVRCESKACEDIGELPASEYSGELPDGTLYSRVMRKLVRCNNCEQVGTILTFVTE